MDKGQIEIVGRNWLIRELLKAGLEVARPERDRGVDLIAYEEGGRSGRFVARPIQLKTASHRSFVVDRKYRTIHGLLLAYVWRVADPEKTCCYCLTYSEVEELARRMNWTRTKSWTERGIYTRTSPSTDLVRLLEPFRMETRKWSQKVGVSANDGDPGP
jgi:hypothetical protein